MELNSVGAEGSFEPLTAFGSSSLCQCSASPLNEFQKGNASRTVDEIRP
jgi:hypothetical protein